MRPTPTRILTSRDGRAVLPSQTKVKPEVLFVRDDGWVLGAPERLEAHACRMAERWAYMIGRAHV